MKQVRPRLFVAITALICMALIGCGGGGGDTTTAQDTPSPGPSAPTLAWDPPTTHTDNSAMDPYRELDYYEIYLRSDANFTDNEAPVAQVAAVANVLAQDGQSSHQELTTGFSLGNLLPFTQPGAVYYLSVKSVGVDGLKSGFSAPVAWNLS